MQRNLIENKIKLNGMAQHGNECTLRLRELNGMYVCLLACKMSTFAIHAAIFYLRKMIRFHFLFFILYLSLPTLTNNICSIASCNDLQRHHLFLLNTFIHLVFCAPDLVISPLILVQRLINHPIWHNHCK